MQCKAGSWTVSSGSDDACSATLKLITIIEVNIEGQTQAKPAEAGVDAVPAKRFEDTIATEVAAICNFRETCSFVPLDVRGRSDATFLVTKLRYACRDRATGSVKIFEPKLPNGGDEHAVYNLDCFGT
jgi:hypothetical protein